MELLQNSLRRPTAASLVSLVAAVAFYVVVGRADISALASAASWLNFAANLGIVALPVGLLMIAGEIDISFGAMIPAGAITTALLSGTFGLPIEVGILGALGLGVVVGLINGLLATQTKVPSLLITLGTLTIMQGIVLWAAMGLAGNASIPLKAPPRPSSAS
jgi:simple sugar transport system permease protein